MIFNTDEDVKMIAKRFEERTLSKTEWTHAAHLAVALYYCFYNPFGVAKNLMRDGIYWLNDSHGTPNTNSSGYHETLTIFWLNKVSEFLEENRNEKSLAVLAGKLLSSYNNSKLPLRFYSSEVLYSVEARRKYVKPDLQETKTIFPASLQIT